MRSMGAHHVIDCTQEDFTKNGQTYDFILDVAAHHSIFDYKRSLSHNGMYVMVGGAATQIFQGIFLGPLISMISSKKMGILAYKANKHLTTLKELFEAGEIVPVIDKCFPLSEVPDAFRYYGTGEARGKVVITI